MGARAMAATSPAAVPAGVLSGPAEAGPSAVVQGFFGLGTRMAFRTGGSMSRRFGSLGGGGGGDRRWTGHQITEMLKKQALTSQSPQQQERPPLPKRGTHFRADNFPFHSVQPGYGTKKSHISPGSTLVPVNPDGATTAAQHVDGLKERKAESPFTSTGTDLNAVSQYGDHLFEMTPQPEQVHDQPALQEAIVKADDPDFDRTAVNRSMEGTPNWTPPTEAHRQVARNLGLDPDGGAFDFRRRAQINTAVDNENLVEGTVPNVRAYRLVRAEKLFSGVKFGSGPGQINLAKIAEAQGRDPRTHHPEGFRVPLDEHGMATWYHLERARQQAREDQRERQDDEEIRSGKITEEELEARNLANSNNTSLGEIPPPWSGANSQGPDQDQLKKRASDRE